MIVHIIVQWRCFAHCRSLHQLNYFTPPAPHTHTSPPTGYASYWGLIHRSKPHEAVYCFTLSQLSKGQTVTVSLLCSHVQVDTWRMTWGEGLQNGMLLEKCTASLHCLVVNHTEHLLGSPCSALPVFSSLFFFSLFFFFNLYFPIFPFPENRQQSPDQLAFFKLFFMDQTFGSIVRTLWFYF